MRVLAVTRGVPGCGKSTFIKNHNLEPYTICADNIRLLFESPVMDHENGYEITSQKNDKRVWQLIFKLLEERMYRGEFCVIDATHSKSKDFSKYKKLIEKYRYRAFCIDFSDVDVETCKKRNKQRETHKRVPETVIENLYSRIQTQDVPSYFKKIHYKDEKNIDLSFSTYEPTDVNNYEKVICFGDIHGCYEPLNEYFKNNPFSNKNLYIFTGDYLDRGLQGGEVINWLLQHYHKNNVWLLQGNHEKHLIDYAMGEYDEEIKNGKKEKCKSTEFFENTIKQIEKIDKKDLRELIRRFRQLAFIKFDNKKFFITHAGVGYLPHDIIKTSANTYIRSNGNYEDPIDEWFEKNEGGRDHNLYQIHAHRNIENLSMHPFEHSFNLCDKVEFGGNLRILELNKGE
jgi:predicted kinase